MVRNDNLDDIIHNTGFLVPKLTEAELQQLASDNAEIRELSLLAILDKSLPALPPSHTFKMRDRRTVELVHHAVFELLGGVPAMALWASTNPTEFYKMYSRLLPPEKMAQTNTQIVINSPLATNALDSVTINGEAFISKEPDGEDE